MLRQESRGITIRSAEEGDYEFVADLMVRALSPFYDGDHRAHAKRIFDTHISGGVDLVGHFSAGQHMYIAEAESNQKAGVIHIVDKRQGTVKISPLIVSPDHRGVAGIGSKLLQHAEDYAKSIGARQIYCTVSALNQSALKFFLKKSFYITGTARNHYKPSIGEHMLYKQIAEDTGYDAPNVSVLPFEEGLHADGVRRLILEGMSTEFDGVDDSWVDALFRGYSRNTSGDVNEKFKIIFVAESAGKVVGVVGATPKKGSPVKLMPLIANSRESFEALVIDSQTLLADAGRKLYVHIVPEAWQVSCLQRHGWSLEGIFPGGYSENSIVQQWGLSLCEEGKVTRKMRIKRPYFKSIMSGEKSLEVRVGYASIKKIKIDELVQLETGYESGTIRIKSIRRYENFSEMLKAEDWRKIMPQAKCVEEALETFRKIYDKRKEGFGVFVFEIEPA